MTKKYHVRRPKTTQERRENGKRSQFARPKRSSCNLPNAWDDKEVMSQRTWKKRRKSQYWVDGRGEEHNVLVAYNPSRIYWLETWMENHNVPCSIKRFRNKGTCTFTWWSDKDVDIQGLLTRFNIEPL